MIAYHGASISNANRLVAAIRNNSIRQPGFYVTDSAERAARYANAQATGIVDPDAISLCEHAAVVALEIPDNTRWLRRTVSHDTLDTCEALVYQARVISIDARECDYMFCTCHRDRAEYSAPQAGERIGLSEQRIRKLCTTRRVGRMVGNRWIIGHEELMALARELRQDTRSPLHKENK